VIQVGVKSEFIAKAQLDVELLMLDFDVLVEGSF
jgi:hypothetical protein